jgi:hypothetical protein
MSHHIYILLKKKEIDNVLQKIWLETFKVAEKGTLNEKELNQAISLIKKNQTILIDSFNKVKNGKKITTLK